MPERIYDRTIAEDLNPVFDGDGASELVCGLVRFTPGARTQLARPRQRAAATTWLEPVTAEQYAAAHTAAGVE